MLRKMSKVMAIAMVLILVAVSYAPAIDAKANEANGNGYKSTKSIIKKLKKNAVSYYPNPDSPQLTYGYALKKIKDFVESDPNAYVGESAGWVEIASWKDIELKFVGGTKSQRKALKWGVDIGLVIHEKEDSDPYSGWKTTYNASQVVTRWQLVDLVSKVIGLCYGSRLPYLNTWEKGFTWNPKETWMTTGYDLQCLYKCVMYILPPGDSEDDYLHLDSQVATREDLSNCLKNLKILAASKYAAKVVYRETPLETYTEKDAEKDRAAIKKFLLSIGLEYGYYNNIPDKYVFVVNSTTSDKCLSGSSFMLAGDTFRTTISVVGGHGNEKSYDTHYDPKVVDVVATFKQIIKKRG